MRNRGQNIYIYLLQKFLLGLGTLLAVQVVFLLCNLRIFHIDGWREWGGVLLGNIVFCTATIATFLLPYMLVTLLPLTKLRWKRWYRIVAEILYIVPIGVIVATRGSNTAYYQFTYRLLSDEIFSYLGISGQMGSLAPLFARDYWYAWVLPLLIFIGFLIINRFIKLAERNPYAKHTSNDIFGFVVGMGVMVVLSLCAGKPANAAHFCQPKNTAVVNNDSYNIFRTMFTPELEPVQYMSDDEADAIFPAIHNPKPKTITDSTTTDSAMRNVVIIVVESLGQEFMGCYNTQEDADTRTPFLDSIAGQSTIYDGRANGKKSIEGIAAINMGLPNLMSQPFNNSPYEKRYTGLPALMRKHGYHTAFFHGSYNGVMDFETTCMHIGFDEYLGKNEYEAAGNTDPDDYDGAWGILDEPYLQYTVKHINSYRKPFLAEIFTVSSHHPYPVPEEYKDRFTGGRHPLLKCVEYTDYSLRRFFEEASKQEWYNNTIFIITGDHSGPGLTRKYNDYDGWYRIPMIIFDPQNREPKRSARIMQQTDLYPTIADQLGFQDSFVSFGQSALQSDKGWQVYYGNGYYCMVSNNVEQPEIHDITIIHGDKEIGTADNLRMLKAIIQQYNYRLINNKLMPEPGE